MKKRTLLDEVRKMQKIAGILKEDDDLDLSDVPRFTSALSDVALMAFVEREEAKKYKDLGFEVELDDPVNEIYFAERAKFTDTMSLLALVEDCQREGLTPMLRYRDKVYTDPKEVYQIADQLASTIRRMDETEENDLDLSDTPEFKSFPSLDQFLENPTYTVFFDDSDWENPIFGLVDHGKNCYLTYDFPADEEEEENFEAVKLKPGLTVEKIIAAGEKQGFFEKNDWGIYVHSNKERKLYNWLDTLKA